MKSAVSYYERAVELDPEFAAAYSAMARARIALANHSREPGRVQFEQARALALRAIALDPGISDAHLALAEIRRMLEWNWRVAEDEYRTAIALSPSAKRRIGSTASFSRPCPVGEAKAEAIARATSIRFASW